MLQPINNFNFSKFILEDDKDILISNDFNLENIQEIQNSLILEVFRENIKNQVQYIINKNIKANYIIQSIDVNLYDTISNSINQTTISSISISLRKQGELINTINSIDISIDPIDPIEPINNFNFESNQDNLNQELINDISKIKELISNEYNLSSENIYIKML